MNRATRIIVITFGTLLAVSGINHGFFEVLQGNKPTDGLIIQAIGKQHQMWFYGGEEAFTIVPNFLLTGLLAIAVSIVIIVWLIGYVHRPRGPLVLFLLFILLFFVGGGIAQVLSFSILCLVATRINKPLTWWRSVLPVGIQPILGKFWLPLLVISSILFLTGLAIAITGYVPGLADPEQILSIDWSILAGGLLFFLLSVVAGFAHDIEASASSTQVASEVVFAPTQS